MPALNAGFTRHLLVEARQRACLPPAEQAALFDVLHLSLKTNIAVIQCEIGTSAAKTNNGADVDPAGREAVRLLRAGSHRRRMARQLETLAGGGPLGSLE